MPGDSHLTLRETEALKAFATAHGRKWKAELLNTYWYNARIWRDADGDMRHGTELHGLRNRLGAAWLIDFRFPSGHL